tara:strand:+ start:218 stop:1042 length:825 start_codon:yes stop_codon:yes gene_type:complete
VPHSTPDTIRGMHDFICIGGITLGSLLLVAGLLHLIPRLGKAGRTLSQWLCVAPGLDLVVGFFTGLPLILGPVFGGWIGLAASVIAQVLAVMIWTCIHGLAHPTARKGPRIVKFLNALVGTWQNFIAVWITAFAVPVFLLVRVAEILVYPWLVWLIRFPKYKQSEWVRVNRFKFENLVGHDLIWCLYCDWMTGVWSLGSEMLRNVESFWCPLRFDNKKKCENCSVDFPDVFNGWARPDGSMEDVVEILKKQYGEAEVNCWFGHPARLTVEGEEQ